MKKNLIKILIFLTALWILNTPAFAMTKQTYKHYKAANDFYVADDMTNAEIEYLKAKELSPYDILIYLKLANLYTEQQEWDKALENYKIALKLAPDDGSIYLNIGSILRTKKDYQSALEAYQKANKLLPNYKRK